MGRMKNIRAIAGLILVGVLVGVVLVTLFPLPQPQNAALRVVGTIDGSGLFTATADGPGDIIAETDHGGQHIVGFARVQVGNGPPPPPPPPPGNNTRVIVSPGGAHLNIGEKRLFSAQVMDRNGTLVSGLKISWSVRSLPVPQATGGQPPAQVPQKDATFYYNAKSIISIVNVTLLAALLYVYTKIYGDVKSKFTLGLIIMQLALLVYALTSNPLLQVLFGFRAEGLGPFAMLPDLFASVGLSILLYLSLE
jgi:hypothetical protein